MILSDVDIFKEVESGGVKFDPVIESDQVSTSSIDLRLGNVFTRHLRPLTGMSVVIDPDQTSPERISREYGETIVVPRGEKFELRPGDFVLGYTLESVELPNYLAARIEGRSKMARFGVSIHQTAPTVQANFKGQLRLEISNIGPYTVLLEPGTRFCQLIIERLSSPAQSTAPSQWQGQSSSD